MENENQKELLAAQGDMPENVQLTDAFDEAKRELREICIAYFRDRSVETRDMLNECEDILAAKFYNAVSFFKENLPPQECIVAVTSLAVGENEERIKLLDDLIHSKKIEFGYMEDEKFKESLEEYLETAESDDDFTEKATDLFQDMLADDLDVLDRYIAKKRKKVANRVRRVIFESLPFEEGAEDEDDAFAFSIEPPIKVIDPKFMGDDVQFTFADKVATRGIIKLPGVRLHEGDDIDEYRLTVHERITDKFSDALDPLGRTAIAAEWQHSD